MDENDSNQARLANLTQRADAKDAEAMYLLGVAYGAGTLVPEDPAMAASWFLKAIRLDHVAAKTSMAYLYASGQGVSRNRQAAYILLREAIGEGDHSAKAVMAILKQRMDADETGRAERKYLTRQRLRTIARANQQALAECAANSNQSFPPPRYLQPPAPESRFTWGSARDQNVEYIDD